MDIDGTVSWQDLRIARALGASRVLALLTLDGLAHKERFARVASPAYTLRRQSPRHLFPCPTMWHCQCLAILRLAIVDSHTASSDALTL